MTAAGEAPDACGDCAWSTSGACCGSHGSSVPRSDRAVLALGGLGVVVVALGALTVGTSRHLVVAVPALVTVALGAAAGVCGALSLRRPEPAAAVLAARGLRLLPAAVAGLLIAVGAALVRSLLG